MTKRRELLPVSEETMKAIWEFFYRTSIPRILEEEKKRKEKSA